MLEEVRPGIIVIGTAHVSPTSVAEVESTIRARRPQRVLVELDSHRLQALRDPEGWQRTDIVQVLRQKKQHLFLLQLYLASMQAQIGRETGVSPGSELLKAVTVAEEVGAEVVLIDREISITLKRGFSAMGFWARLRMFWKVWLQLLTPAAAEGGAPVKPDGKVDVEAMLQTDAITQMTDEFARFAPEVKLALIDERDAYMASHIDEQAARGSLVAVVGAGHMPGIRRMLAEGKPVDRKALDALPAKRLNLFAAFSLALPILFAAVLGYYLYIGNYDQVKHQTYYWVISHAVLAAAGGALALGHPLAILVGACAAPFTSFLPTGLKSGWMAGFTQAWVRKPTVADFQDIKRAETFGQFYRNHVVRILLVTALVNLGSMVATYLTIYNVIGGA